MGSEAAELSLLITGDAEIAELNESFRGKAGATDVLSFPQSSGSGEAAPAGTGEAPLLGDVVISLPTALRQAAELEVSPGEELLRLLIHGVLHLHGYDHENVSESEVWRMEAKESELYAELVDLVR